MPRQVRAKGFSAEIVVHGAVGCPYVSAYGLDGRLEIDTQLFQNSISHFLLRTLSSFVKSLN
jgi:hypothetical protein